MFMNMNEKPSLEKKYKTVFYYSIGSFERNGEIFYEHHLWQSKKEAEKVYNSLKETFPKEKPILLKGWVVEAIKGREQEFIKKWTKAKEFCQRVAKRKLSLEELPDEL